MEVFILTHKEIDIDMQINSSTDLRALKEEQSFENLLGQKLRQRKI